MGRNELDCEDLKQKDIIYFISASIYFVINFIPVIPAGNEDANSQPKDII